jgi:1,4-alpha-glucan branching enzyme
MAMLSAGTPMFLMGEEVGAQKDYRYNDFADNREDLYGLRQGDGALLFRFYQDLIRFRLSHPGLRSHDIDIVYTYNPNRILAFRRFGSGEEFLVVASLNNQPFTAGYTIDNFRIANGRWQEVFNSDMADYGGDNVGNFGVNISSSNGRISVVIPASGFIVLQRQF